MAYIRTSPEFEKIITERDSLVLKRLVGRWQDMPGMGSGWGTNYSFNSDGTYYFEKWEGGDGHSGTWKVQSGRLVLMRTREWVIMGGKTGPGGGIVGGEHITKEHNPPKKFNLSLSSLEYHKVPWYPSIEIDGTAFWLMAGTR